MVPRAGFEPAKSPGSEPGAFTNLTTGAEKGWIWKTQCDSNARLPTSKAGALPTELWVRKVEEAGGPEPQRPWTSIRLATGGRLHARFCFLKVEMVECLGVEPSDVLVPNQAAHPAPCTRKDGGEDGNQTHRTVLARHHRPLGTCLPVPMKMVECLGVEPSDVLVPNQAAHPAPCTRKKWYPTTDSNRERLVCRTSSPLRGTVGQSHGRGWPRPKMLYH